MNDFSDYTENNYTQRTRRTSERYRAELVSWQVPAIKKYFGDLTGKTFIDVGAGDIVLGEQLDEIGVPKKFYVQDIRAQSLDIGLKRLSANGVDISIFHQMVSDNFDFSDIKDEELDGAFSNSLFSHLSINSIALCLRNLFPKMKPGGRYLSSMIVLPGDDEVYQHDWSYMNKPGTRVVSFATKDPYHYTSATIRTLTRLDVGFKVKGIRDYGHPFQKLVEFHRL